MKKTKENNPVFEKRTPGNFRSAHLFGGEKGISSLHYLPL